MSHAATIEAKPAGMRWLVELLVALAVLVFLPLALAWSAPLPLRATAPSHADLRLTVAQAFLVAMPVAAAMLAARSRHDRWLAALLRWDGALAAVVAMAAVAGALVAACDALAQPVLNGWAPIPREAPHSTMDWLALASGPVLAVASVVLMQGFLFPRLRYLLGTSLALAIIPLPYLLMPLMPWSARISAAGFHLGLTLLVTATDSAWPAMACALGSGVGGSVAGYMVARTDPRVTPVMFAVVAVVACARLVREVRKHREHMAERELRAAVLGAE